MRPMLPQPAFTKQPFPLWKRPTSRIGQNNRQVSFLFFFLHLFCALLHFIYYIAYTAKQMLLLDLHRLYHLQPVFLRYPSATTSRKRLGMITKSYIHNRPINCHNKHWNYSTMNYTSLSTTTQPTTIVPCYLWQFVNTNNVL
jgi:hypothetical protein